MTEEIFLKLDLGEYLDKFNSFLARQKPLFLQGDSKIHFENISELSKYDFKAPDEIKELDDALMRLSKQAVLHISEIYEFAKIIKYFSYLKKQKFEGRLGEWIAKVEIPEAMSQMANSFDENGEFSDSVDERFHAIKQAFSEKKRQIDAELKKLIYSKHITPYLVDTQTHYINSQEALLVRGGFNHALKGTVIARSSGGYFYVAPANTERLKKEQSELLDRKEEIIFEHCKKFSLQMSKSLLFLKFINNAFDQFDAYQARVNLARSRDYEFVLPNSSHVIKLEKFAHPALKNPKSVSVDFSKKVLLITGVNAGGKSMLLKSIISATLLAKYLLPMRIDANRSSIGSFKEFDAIIEDPQSVKNDISTFAGRMVHFARLFTKKSIIIGIDEIELGTDFEEAASLYGVMIERLITQDIKMIITTHHKRLAMLLAKNPEVELVAALYDEAAQRPKFEFLKGTIGKSYAFETAARYGISQNLVAQAKKIYGEDKENLNEIITKTLNLQTKLDEGIKEVTAKEERLERLLEEQKELKEKNEIKLNATIARLEKEYYEAINAAKAVINFKDIKDKQRALNVANEKKAAIVKSKKTERESLKVGDRVKYENIKGTVLSISKNDAMIESNGINLRVPLELLRKNGNEVVLPKKGGVSLSVDKPKTASLSLDLHGIRADEAIAKLDKFISDSLVMGFDEVSVFHGIGTGKLAFAVKNFLKEHPSVKEFHDAPANQGGYGAKIVKL
ncbi:endonuclease MutS2 [Campylobacter concisus]|uniref:Endonuclease MutS2 n=1 Tax=Campylobacter concisus UNSW2 TaxID=1242965 RepID=U2GX08_9BACT|nr:endonuclease MutS2 [Campylobacter concisus]ERJ32634.1 Recombination inhibitory protein MutS2 [Campylobacter concisus UNSW2]